MDLTHTEVVHSRQYCLTQPLYKDVCDQDPVVHEEDEVTVTFSLGEKVSALEGTGSLTTLRRGVIVEIDWDIRSYVICCRVSGYKNDYNMLVPFEEASTRINQPVHLGKRKRKEKTILDL